MEEQLPPRCPAPDDHRRIKSLQLQVAALKAEAKAAERRDAQFKLHIRALEAELQKHNRHPSKLDIYAHMAMKDGVTSLEEEQQRQARGFCDRDLGVCLRVIHAIVMRPSLIPEYAPKLGVAKILFKRDDPMPVVKSKFNPMRSSLYLLSNIVLSASSLSFGHLAKMSLKRSRARPPNKSVMRARDRQTKQSYCKLRKDYMGAINAIRKGLPELVRTGKVSLDGEELKGALELVDQALPIEPGSEVGLHLNSGKLYYPASCWTCHKQYTVLHPVYDKLCGECAQLNIQKRLQMADLSGKVALVTGARIKIGYDITLRLLRMGARVVATTRFPVNAVLAFAKEPDFDSWRDRLMVYGLDMRSVPTVERFCAFVQDRFPQLHILINNAAQTIAKPAGFYASLMQIETQGADYLPSALQPMLLHDNRTLIEIGSGNAPALPESVPLQLVGATSAADQAPADDAVKAAPPCIPVPFQGGDHLDLRAVNSWILRLDQVSTVEFLEVQLINVVAPFLLSARLRSLMRQTEGRKFIINVSAMEGQFYRWKSCHHAHTNAAKAALNMITRTTSVDYESDGISVTSVDTGWITDELPLRRQGSRKDAFSPPLSIEDGAARCLDPIIMGYNGTPVKSGLFYKDYRPTYW